MAPLSLAQEVTKLRGIVEALTRNKAAWKAKALRMIDFNNSKNNNIKELKEKVTRYEKALLGYKHIADNYAFHLGECDIDKTDFCTCGLQNELKDIRNILEGE